MVIHQLVYKRIHPLTLGSLSKSETIYVQYPFLPYPFSSFSFYILGNVLLLTVIRAIGISHKIIIISKIWMVSIWRITNNLPNFPASYMVATVDIHSSCICLF